MVDRNCSSFKETHFSRTSNLLFRLTDGLSDALNLNRSLIYFMINYCRCEAEGG
jgi:hypothetical protein